MAISVMCDEDDLAADILWLCFYPALNCSQTFISFNFYRYRRDAMSPYGPRPVIAGSVITSQKAYNNNEPVFVEPPSFLKEYETQVRERYTDSQYGMKNR